MDRRRTVAPVGWALAFGSLTTVGLAVLAAALLVEHTLVYGAATVIRPETRVAAPDGGRYGLAFAVGAVVNLGMASALGWTAPRTAIRTWPPVVQGLGAALVAAVAAGCVLLLTLGIDPVGFVLSL
ncbi:MAG: hypothetical protein ACLGIV_11285 [Actinomycetes bacterium]